MSLTSDLESITGKKIKSSSSLGTLGRALLQGVTLGSADEIYGWGAGEEARKDYLAQLEADKRYNPKTAMAAEIGGGVIPAAVLTTLTGGTLPALAASSAAVGGAAGAFNADEGSRLQSGAMGALLGGTVGAAIPAAGKAIGAISKKIAPSISKGLSSKRLMGLENSVDESLIPLGGDELGAILREGVDTAPVLNRSLGRLSDKKLEAFNAVAKRDELLQNTKELIPTAEIKQKVADIARDKTVEDFMRNIPLAESAFKRINNLDEFVSPMELQNTVDAFNKVAYSKGVPVNSAGASYVDDVRRIVQNPLRQLKGYNDLNKQASSIFKTLRKYKVEGSEDTLESLDLSKLRGNPQLAKMLGTLGDAEKELYGDSAGEALSNLINQRQNLALAKTRLGFLSPDATHAAKQEVTSSIEALKNSLGGDEKFMNQLNKYLDAEAIAAKSKFRNQGIDPATVGAVGAGKAIGSAFNSAGVPMVGDIIAPVAAVGNAVTKTAPFLVRKAAQLTGSAKLPESLSNVFKSASKYAAPVKTSTAGYIGRAKRD